MGVRTVRASTGLLRHFLLPGVGGILLAVFVASSASADDYAKAVRAYDASRFATVVRLIEPLAKSGDPRAQHLLGRTYEGSQGRDGVRSSDAKALFWYEKAAKQGYVPGKRSLGKVLVRDRIDVRRGYYILLDLAERGDTQAQGMLGAYLTQQANLNYPKKYLMPGTPEDGLNWLHRAADKKDTLAVQVLMRWYRDQGELPEGYFWDLVVGGVFGERGPRILPPISKRLSKQQRVDVERRAAAWLTARGIKPMHSVKAK
jgi:TPR repeat protein